MTPLRAQICPQSHQGSGEQAPRARRMASVVATQQCGDCLDAGAGLASTNPKPMRKSPVLRVHFAQQCARSTSGEAGCATGHATCQFLRHRSLPPLGWWAPIARSALGLAEPKNNSDARALIAGASICPAFLVGAKRAGNALSARCYRHLRMQLNLLSNRGAPPPAVPQRSGATAPKSDLVPQLCGCLSVRSSKPKISGG